MQRRHQAISLKPEGLANKAHIVINERLRQWPLVGIPVQAGGQGLTELNRMTGLIELLSNTQNKSGLSAERFA
jgi:hypothetical protein